MSELKDLREQLKQQHRTDPRREAAGKLVGDALGGVGDFFGGVIVKSVASVDSAEIFKEKLDESLEKWRSDGKRGIWLHIAPEKAAFMPIAIERGFIFHHAQPQYCCLVAWLPTDAPNTLPKYASHFIGVGAMVLNPKNEILVIQEKNGPITGIWKLPGGMVDVGEDICDAAARELFEETGIRAQHIATLCFRENHATHFGLSDLYYVCHLHPENYDIKVQQSEIADAKWMPAEEFAALPYYKGLWQKLVGICNEQAQGRYEGWKAEKLPIAFRKGENRLYHGSKL